MRTLFYYAGCLFMVAFIVLGLLASCQDAHAQPPQLLPHTVAGGDCDLWEAKYRNEPDALGWIHFEDVVVRGYRNCADCDFVGRYQKQHFSQKGYTLEYYCVDRAKGVRT